MIVIVSMLLKKPFTIQYSKEQTPPEHWNSPLFLKINWILTSVWAVLMIIMALPSYLFSQSYIQDSFFYNYGLSVLCIVLGIRCNKTLPKWIKKYHS